MVTASRFHGNQREDGSQAPCCPHAGPRCGRKRPFASLGSQKRPCHGPKDSSPPPGSLGDAGERLPCARLQETDGHCHYPSWWGGAVRAPVVGGCPPFCLLLAPPQSPQSQGLRRAQTTTPRPPRCIPHPPRSLDIRPPSPGGAPAPLPPVRSSCPLTGSSAGCLPSGHHHQLSRNQKPHKQKITKPSAEINDIENKAIEKINENKNPIL